MAHDALDAWLDQIEAEATDAPTLLEISERFMQTRLTLLSACLETVIHRRYVAELQQTEAVCACGRRLFRRRLDAKEISTLHGRVTLHRPYFYCDTVRPASIPWTRSCSSRTSTISSISRSGPREWAPTCRSA
jgi:hypothetical protein